MSMLLPARTFQPSCDHFESIHNKQILEVRESRPVLIIKPCVYRYFNINMYGSYPIAWEVARYVGIRMTGQYVDSNQLIQCMQHARAPPLKPYLRYKKQCSTDKLGRHQIAHLKNALHERLHTKHTDTNSIRAEHTHASRWKS